MLYIIVNPEFSFLGPKPPSTGPGQHLNSDQLV